MDGHLKDLSEEYVSQLIAKLHNNYYLDEKKRKEFYDNIAGNAKFALQKLAELKPRNEHYERLINNIFANVSYRDENPLGLGLPGHTKMIREDGSDIPYTHESIYGWKIDKASGEETVYHLQDIYVFCSGGYTSKNMSGKLAIITNPYFICVFGIEEDSHLTTCPYSRSTINLIKHQILEFCDAGK